VAERFRTASSGSLFIDAPTLGAKTVFFVALAVVAMMVDRHEGTLRAVRSTLEVMVYPLQLAVNAPSAFGHWVGENLSSRNTLMDRNDELARSALETSGLLQRMAALEAENQRLRQLMGSSERLDQKVAVAEVLAVDLDPFRHRIVIDKGSNAGAYVGQPIIDANGIMGQLASVSAFSSQAVLITDASHALPIEVNRNGLRSIAVGTGDIDRLELPYLPNNADVREGDLLVSSGLGGRFPRGFPVGFVRKVTRDPGRAFATIEAAPAAQLNRSREVLMVFAQFAFVGPPVLEAPAAAKTGTEATSTAPATVARPR
jgi:rod shape-determining protein MreC